MKKAFSLIELLIVVAIIGILSGIMVVSYTGYQVRARDTKRKADIKSIAMAIEAYKSTKGKIPVKCGTKTITGRTLFDKIDRSDNQFGCTEVAWVPETKPLTIDVLIKDSYLTSQPTDPKSDTTRGYYYRSDGKNYKIVSYLPEQLEGATSADCKKIAGDYYDPKDECKGYQVSSNSEATKDW